MKRPILKSFRALCLVPLTVLYLMSAALVQAAPPEVTSPGKSEAAKMTAAVDMRMAMRKLWEEHIVYTRNYIISEIADLPDKYAVAQRLLRNQEFKKK